MRDENAEYNDGNTAARHKVVVLLEVDGLYITSDMFETAQHWPYEGLRAIDPPHVDTPIRLASRTAPHARLWLNDPSAIEALRQRAPHLFLAELNRPNVRRILAITLLALLALGLFLWRGVPLLSEPLAQLVPSKWAYNFGEEFRDNMLAGAKQCQSVNGTAALSRLTKSLTANMSWQPRLTLFVADQGTVNAFALPGGHIVVLRGLLAKAESPDEVAAVLAHEIGHVHHRHPTQMAIRAIGVSLFADLFTGDGSAVMEVVTDIGGLLLLMNYSRDMERQADAYGQDLLRQAGLFTGGLAQLFARIHEGPAKTTTANVLSYFSSHPPLKERIAETDEDKASRPALDEGAWRALQNICD